MLTLDLEQLERVAKAAIPGPWRALYDDRRENHQIHAERFWVANTMFGSLPNRDKENATHIATFNPATVLRLLAICRAAKEMRDNWVSDDGDFVELQAKRIEAFDAAWGRE